MTYQSRGRSMIEAVIAVTFSSFLIGFITVLCIGNYLRAKRAMERQKQRRIDRFNNTATTKDTSYDTTKCYNDDDDDSLSCFSTASSLSEYQRLLPKSNKKKSTCCHSSGSSFSSASNFPSQRLNYQFGNFVDPDGDLLLDIESVNDGTRVSGAMSV